MKTTPPSEAPRRARNLPRRGAALILLALICLLAPSAPAAAHSELISSSPANGATVAASPSTVSLTFSEGIAPTYAVVTLRVGTNEVATLETVVRGDRITASVPPALHGGNDWRVGYRIVSADGHPVTGKVTFKVATPESTPTPGETPTSAAPAAPIASPSAARGSINPPSDDSGTSDSTDDGGGVNPGFSVLAIALLVSAPVVVFVIIGNRKRREDQQNLS